MALSSSVPPAPPAAFTEKSLSQWAVLPCWAELGICFPGSTLAESWVCLLTKPLASPYALVSFFASPSGSPPAALSITGLMRSSSFMPGKAVEPASTPTEAGPSPETVGTGLVTPATPPRYVEGGRRRSSVVDVVEPSGSRLTHPTCCVFSLRQTVKESLISWEAEGIICKQFDHGGERVERMRPCTKVRWLFIRHFSP